MVKNAVGHIEDLLCQGKSVAVWYTEPQINDDVTCEIYGFRQSFYKTGKKCYGLHAWNYDTDSWDMCEEIADDWRKWHFKEGKVIRYAECQTPEDSPASVSIKADGDLLDWDCWNEWEDYHPWIS